MKARFAALLFLLLALTGCASKDARPVSPTASTRERPIEIGYSCGNMNNPFSREFLKFVQDECDARGVKLLALDAENDVARQASIVQQWTREGVDAVLCSPVNPTALQASVDGCLKAGIPFINLDSECERKTAYIGVDQYAYGYEAGRIAADWINTNLPDEKSVECMILTKPQSLAVIERANGIASALQALCPRASIVDTSAYSDLESAATATKEAFARHPQIHCIVGVADVSVLGAYRAVETLGLRHEGLCLVGLDATQDLLELLRAGSAVRGSVSQNTKRFAQTAVAAALDAIDGKSVPLRIIMEIVPVTAENVNAFCLSE